MNIQAEVKHLASPLRPGQSLRTTCPSCNRPDTFSVTRIDDGVGVLYNCYRASCGERGYVSSQGGNAHAAAMPPRRRSANPYMGELHRLQERDYDYFLRRFGLPRDSVPAYGVYRSSLNDSLSQYVLELKDIRGNTRGHAVRRGGWKGTPPTPGKIEDDVPKTKTYMLYPDIAQHIQFPLFESSPRNTAVIVEDYISALKVAHAGYTGVALMGTTMNADRAREIRELRTSSVVIALDQDAMIAAVEMARDWGLSWRATGVVMLDQDIKDMPNEKVLEILR